MKYFLLTLVFLLLLNGLKDLVNGGAFRQIHPHFSGSCEKILGIIGPEDMEYASDLNALFISSDQRSEDAEGLENGSIYKWDLKDPKSAPVKLQFKNPLTFAFHPHGLGLFENHQGLTRVWAVNHRSSQETSIEVFDYLSRENLLVHIKSHQNQVLMNANDLVPVNETSFYVTHDHGFFNPWLKFLEDVSVAGRGYVTFFDEKGAYLVKATGIAYANGIAIDPLGTHVYIASTMHQEINVFKRDLTTGDLDFEKKIHLNAAPDNLYRDPQGELWVAAHPSILALTIHNKHHERLAPSEVIEIKTPLSDDEKIQEIFLDDGKLVSAASVAFRKDDRLILGSIFGDHLLDCRVTGAKSSVDLTK